MTALIEYVVRLRLEEPTAELPGDQVGEDMIELLMAIEDVAVDQEIVSRTVLPGPGAPSRVRCAARKLDPTLHYATSTKWQIWTPDGKTTTVCSAACAVSWFCEQNPADATAAKVDTPSEAG